MNTNRAFRCRCRQATLLLLLVPIGCLIFTMGCTNKNVSRTQAKISTMSNKELINHYKMLEMQMDDIDRAREISLEQKKDIISSHYPDEYPNQLEHLHISDNWNWLKKEKELTLIEIENRGMMPP